METEIKAMCTVMCPPDECQMRQQNALIHQLETDDPWASSSMFKPNSKFDSADALAKARQKSTPSVANLNKMVKAYSRSAADKIVRAEDVRTFESLNMSVDYLLNRVANTEDSRVPERWAIIYPFVADRLRAVRQDMILQQLPPEQAGVLLEKMIPFYLMSPFLFSADGTIPKLSTAVFDLKLHSNELEECFSKWKSGLDDFGIGSATIKAAYLLHYCDRVESLVNFLNWRDDFRHSSPNAEEIYEILMAYRMNNYVAFFRRYAQIADGTLRYALKQYVRPVRTNALKTMLVAYRSANERLNESLIARWLLYSSVEECRSAIETITGKKLARKAAKTAAALAVGIVDEAQHEEGQPVAVRTRSNFNKLASGAFFALGNSGGSFINNHNSGFGSKFSTGFNGFPTATTTKTILPSAPKQTFTGNSFNGNGGSSLFPAYFDDLRSTPSSSVRTKTATAVLVNRKGNKRRMPLSSAAYDEAFNDDDEAASSRPLLNVDDNSNGLTPTTTLLLNSGAVEKESVAFPMSFGSFNGLNGLANGRTISIGHSLEKRKSVEDQQPNVVHGFKKVIEPPLPPPRVAEAKKASALPSVVKRSVVTIIRRPSLEEYEKAERLKEQKVEADEFIQMQVKYLIELTLVAQVKSIAAECLNEAKRIEKKMAAVRENLFNIWKRQFVNRWINVTRRKRGFQTLELPLMGGDETLAGPLMKRLRLCPSALSTSHHYQAPTADDLQRQLALRRLKVARQTRLARDYFQRWRAFVEQKRERDYLSSFFEVVAGSSGGGFGRMLYAKKKNIGGRQRSAGLPNGGSEMSF